MQTSTQFEPNVVDLTPLNGPLGACATNIDLTVPLSSEVRDEILAAFLQHGLLWFPNQALSPTQQASFAKNFGELASYPFVTPVPEHDKVVPIIYPHAPGDRPQVGLRGAGTLLAHQRHD